MKLDNVTEIAFGGVRYRVDAGSLRFSSADHFEFEGSPVARTYECKRSDVVTLRYMDGNGSVTTSAIPKEPDNEV